MAAVPSSNPNQAALSVLYQQEEVFRAAVASHQYTKAQIQSGLDATNAQIRSLGGTPQYLAEGGLVTKPTLAVIGEAGPEAVIPLNKLGGSVGNSTQTNTIYVTVNIANITKEVSMEEVEESVIAGVVKAVDRMSS